MSKAVVCSHCGGNDIDTDQARGNAVCVTCGAVLEDNFIVSEVSFAENSLGGTSVIGQFVSSEGDKSHTIGNSFHHGFGKESRTVTLQTGRRHILQLGGQLKLNQQRTDMAYNFFKMAISKKLTRGRKTQHIVAACLYLVCRLESTPHMLLDLSDLLQVNVYVLGKTYLKLCLELHINVPAIDPCLFIQRFAHKLEFGEKTDDVCLTALRLVQRMKRDWMHTGRRPSGLCGAALLVAARLHNFCRTQRDVIKVVKVCDATLRKRLSEFEETPSGKLTIDEFHKIDLEEEQDPPSFTRGRRNAKLAQLEELSKQQIRELEGEITSHQQDIDTALHKKAAEKASLLANDAQNDGDRSKDSSRCDSPTVFIEKLHTETVNKVIESELNAHKQLDTRTTSSAEINTEDNVIENSTVEGVGDKQRTGSEGGGGGGKGDGDKDANTSEDLPDAVDKVIRPEIWEGGKMVQGLRPSTLSLGLENILKEAAAPDEKSPDAEDDGELDLTGIDDKELDRFILSEKEVQLKTTLWMKENGEYMKQLEEKEQRLQKEKEENQDQPKKKRKTCKRPAIQANTAGEAIEKLIVEKKISSKINYDVLRDLTLPSTPKPVHENPSPVTPSLLPSGNTGTAFRLGSSHGTSLVRTGGLSGLKRQRPNIAPAKTREAPAKKMVKLEMIEEDQKPFTVPQPTTSVDVVVESGPVQYHAEDGLNHEEEGEEEYYDEDEEEHMQSAAQLMGHRGDDDYHDGYDLDDLE